MSAATTTRARNGFRHGDVSYISLGLRDVARGRAFFGAVLGWWFRPGSGGHGVQVDDVVPMIGLSGGEPGGAVLGFRVDDIAAAAASVRTHGGPIDEPQQPYGLAAEGRDDQGMPFYLHELPAVSGVTAGAGDGFHNGDVEGDVSYLTMVVLSVEAAQRFYGGVLGWTFNVGTAGGVQVTGVAPQIGMTAKPAAGPVAPGVILCFRVDDLASAVRRVDKAGGRAGAVVNRPYGLESLCVDDQGTLFYLHQF